MADKKPDWKKLFYEARHLLAEEVRRHEIGCGCGDYRDTAVVEGPCPGIAENRAFIKKTETLLAGSGEPAKKRLVAQCTATRNFRSQGCTLYCMLPTHSAGDHMNDAWDSGDAAWLEKSGRIVGDRYYWPNKQDSKS